MRFTKSLCLFAAFLALATPAAAQQQPGKIIDCHQAIIIPGTTPTSCDVSPSRVEYQGASNDAQITLSCLWTVQNGVPVADTRYYLTHAIMPATGSEQITMRAGDKIVAILSRGNGPIQTEVLSANGLAARNCANVDIARFAASGCAPAQAAISPQMISDTDSSMTQACHNYVTAMAMGGSITPLFFNPIAASTHLAGAVNFADGLSR